MKILGSFLIIAVILCASTPVSAELSVEDLEKIRQIVNESEVRLGNRIDEVKKELDTRIEDQGKRITGLGDRITDLRERIGFQGSFNYCAHRCYYRLRCGANGDYCLSVQPESRPTSSRN